MSHHRSLEQIEFYNADGKLGQWNNYTSVYNINNKTQENKNVDEFYWTITKTNNKIDILNFT